MNKETIDILKNRVIIFVSIIPILAGCSTLDVSGANNSKSHILYEHRTPITKTAIVQAAEKGVLGTLGFPVSGVWNNPAQVSLGATDIIRAVQNEGFFPFSVIPEMINEVLKGTARLKEETSEQEVSKLYYTDGMMEMKAQMADHTIIETSWKEKEKINVSDRSDQVVVK